MPHVGVILSGCGVFDGAEIHEAVATLTALDQRGASYACLAPDTEFDEIDHRTQQPTGTRRSVIREAARIARGNIEDLASVNGADFDAIVLPGGFGAAKNLCTFATEGAGCSVESQTERVLREAHAAGKPIGFICIAPAVGAKVFGKEISPTLTIGHDAGTASGLESLGAVHRAVGVADIVVDDANRIVSTPAYMEARGPAEVFEGIGKLVERVLAMAGSPANA